MGQLQGTVECRAQMFPGLTSAMGAVPCSRRWTVSLPGSPSYFQWDFRVNDLLKGPLNYKWLQLPAEYPSAQTRLKLQQGFTNLRNELKKKIFLFNLAVWALSCSTRDLLHVMWLLLLWLMDSLVVTFGLSCPVVCGIFVPQPGIDPMSPCIARWIFFFCKVNFYLSFSFNYRGGGSLCCV